jgi:hypothetical protein
MSAWVRAGYVETETGVFQQDAVDSHTVMETIKTIAGKLTYERDPDFCHEDRCSWLKVARKRGDSSIPHGSLNMYMVISISSMFIKRNL